MKSSPSSPTEPAADAGALPPLAEIPRGDYAYPGPLRDALVAAILAGRKTTTTCLLAEYEAEGQEVEAPGGLEAVVDSEDRVVCITRTTDVDVVRLGDVSDDHARREGEGYADAREWRLAHERFWRSPEFVADMGEVELTDDTPVVCFRFEVVRRFAEPVATATH